MCQFPNPDQRLKRFPVAMLLLAMAVFGWGLHYKLALYVNSVRVQASEPAAKLLSERERPTESSAQSIESPTPPTQVTFVDATAPVLMHLPVRPSHLHDSGPAPRAIPVLLESSLFMRPPPASSLS